MEVHGLPAMEAIDVDTLHQDGSWLFEGADHGGVGLSFFLIDSLPGAGPDLHAHPYTEVFVVHEGEATFVVGDESLVAVGGQVVVAPAHLPHKFRNSGAGRLRMTNLHPSERTITRWLEQ
jgi:mannose-6-phosphate isomerase-like protein (cupin superfamily)